MGELAPTLVSLSGHSAVEGIIPAPLTAQEQRAAETVLMVYEGHERPVVVLNVEGYYSRVLAWVKALYIRLDNGSRQSHIFRGVKQRHCLQSPWSSPLSTRLGACLHPNIKIACLRIYPATVRRHSKKVISVISRVISSQTSTFKLPSLSVCARICSCCL